MKDVDVRLRGEIVAAVKRAIQYVGADAFKRTSLFGSSQAQDVSMSHKKRENTRADLTHTP